MVLGLRIVLNLRSWPNLLYMNFTLTDPASSFSTVPTETRDISGMNLLILRMRLDGETVEKDGSAVPKSGVSGKIKGSVRIHTLII